MNKTSAQLEACRAGGRVQGRIAADSGQLRSVTTFESCSKGGSIGIRKMTDAARRRGAIIAGHKAAENRTGIHAFTHEQRVEIGKRAGTAKLAIHGTGLTKEICRRGGQVACHLRYHLETPNPKKCVICQEAGKRVPDQYI